MARNRWHLMAAVWMALAGALTCQARAGALDQARVSAHAQWVLHVDMEGLTSSPGLGGFLADQIKNQSQIQAGLALLKTMTGIDPLRDLKSITVYSTSEADKDTIILVNGTIDQAKLLAMAKASEGFQESQLDGTAVYTWRDKGKDGKTMETRVGAFVGADRLLLGGDMAAFKQALAVVNGGGASLAGNAARFGAAPAKGTYLGLYILEVGSAPALGQPSFDAIVSGRVEMGEADGNFFVNARFNAKDEAAAQDLGQMAQGLLACGDLLRYIRFAGMPVFPPLVNELLHEVKVTVDKSTAAAALATPVAKWRALLDWAAAQGAAGGGRMMPMKP